MNDQTENQTTPTNEPSELEKIQAELANMTNTAKRAMADLQNYKNQAIKEKQQLQGLIRFNLLAEFLPILDNLNLALKQLPADLQDNNFTKGIQSIQKQFQSVIQAAGLTPIEHDGLDPLLHEVISTLPGEKDQILEIIEQGYLLDEKVLKPSKVIVGQG